MIVHEDRYGTTPVSQKVSSALIALLQIQQMDSMGEATLCQRDSSSPSISLLRRCRARSFHLAFQIPSPRNMLGMGQIRKV